MMSNQNPHPRDMRHSQIPLGCLTPPPHPLGLYIDRYIIVVLNNNSNNNNNIIIIIIIITIIMTIKKGFVTIDRQAHLY